MAPLPSWVAPTDGARRIPSLGEPRRRRVGLWAPERRHDQAYPMPDTWAHRNTTAGAPRCLQAPTQLAALVAILRTGEIPL